MGQTFYTSVPIGAEQYGWGSPNQAKQPRWKKRVAETAVALDKIFGGKEPCLPRSHTESIGDFGQRLASMERYRELASVIKMYVEKYELAKFSPLEMTEEDLDQTLSYLQQMLGSVQHKQRVDALGPGGIEGAGAFLARGAMGATLATGVPFGQGAERLGQGHWRPDAGLEGRRGPHPGERGEASAGGRARHRQGTFAEWDPNVDQDGDGGASEAAGVGPWEDHRGGWDPGGRDQIELDVLENQHENHDHDRSDLIDWGDHI